MMKLVRDKIPNIAKVKEQHRFRRITSDKKFLEALKQKLVEEAEETSGTSSKEELILELVDIMEVISEIGKLLGATPAELESLRKKKSREKGGFLKRIMMLSR